MNVSCLSPILAQTSPGRLGGSFRDIVFDWPTSPVGWAALIGGFALLAFYIVWIYRKDTRELGFVSRHFLLLLRLAVVAGLIVIAISPQEKISSIRTQHSRVAILIDNSLSMRHPEIDPKPGETSDTTRADATRQFLENSPLIANLRKNHEVSVYTFGETIEGPIARLKSERQIEELKNTPGLDRTAWENEIDPLPEGFWEEVVMPSEPITNLYASVQDVIAEFDRERLAGVVVISDGSDSSIGSESTDVVRQAANIEASGRQPDELSDDSQARARRSIPLITLGTGSLDPPKVLEIASVNAPTFVRLESDFVIQVSLRSQELEDASENQVRLELQSRLQGRSDEDYQTLTEKTQIVRLEPNTITGPILFRVPEDEVQPGVTEYRVVATPVNGNLAEIEGLRTNEFQVTARERNTGVLVIAGGPLRDYRFLTTMLDRKDDTDVDVWLQSIDPENDSNISQACDILFSRFPNTFPRRPLKDGLPGFAEYSEKDKKKEAAEYDVVIMMDPDWDAPGFGEDTVERMLNVAKISEWVKKDSGGLVLVAGDVNTRDLTRFDWDKRAAEVAESPKLNADQKRSLRDLSIPDLYPVALKTFFFSRLNEEDDPTPAPIKLSPEGRVMNFMRFAEDPVQSIRDWEAFEGIYAAYPTDGIKAGTTVYAEFADYEESTAAGLPVFSASQRLGTGFVFYIGSPETWRFRSLSEDHFDTFWNELINNAAEGRRRIGSTLSVELMDKKAFNVRERVQIKVRLQDANGDPLSDPNVKPTIRTPSGRLMKSPPTLKPLLDDDGEPTDEFVAEFRPREPGQYDVTIQNRHDSEPLKLALQVRQPDIEDRNRQQDAQGLTQLTADTGGGYYTLDEAIKLESEAAARSSDAEQTEAGDGEESSNGEEPSPGDTAEESAENAAAAAKPIAISARLPDRNTSKPTTQSLTTLWDRAWVMYLLIGILSVEWLTRKLLKLA